MRKVVREAQWTVTLIPAGQAQQLEKQVEAPSQDAAVRRAINMFPNMQFIRVEAVAMDPQNIPLGQQPINPQQQLPRQLTNLRQLRPLAVPGQQQQQQQQEGIDPRRFVYPYSIRLPAQFSRVLQESAPVPVTAQYGQYEIILMNEVAMRSLIEKLHEHRNREIADIILNGIRSSQGDW